MVTVAWGALRSMARSGQIAANTWVFHDGMTDWVGAASVLGLFPEQAAGRRDLIGIS